MATALKLKLGPADHGRAMTLEEFESGDYQEGYKYELIDGRLIVVPGPDLPEIRVENWWFRKVARYAEDHPDVINFAHNKSRVFVPGRRRATCPEPDLAAFRDFPLDLPFSQVNWRDVSPILVGEVMTGDPEKDLSRNSDLYFQVPSIREYWVLDARVNPERPTLIQHRRYGRRWVVREYPYGSTFTTRLLPGFTLRIDPRS